VDECALGTKSGTSTCKLWDMKQKAFVAADPVASMHDRARDYAARLRASNMPAGAVMNADYTDATRATLSHYDGFHDSAIWTGSALAAESWRLLATGAPDAAAEVATVAATLHGDFTATGDPGYLARVVVPHGAAPPLDEVNPCTTDPEWHCGVSANGGVVDWLGATSRDQYTGVLLGDWVAYDATADENVKTMLRSDVVTIASELMKARKGVPATIVVNGIPLQKSLDLENVILAPSEMSNGRVQIALNTQSPSDSNIKGMREFFPDYSVIVSQAIGVGVPIPRPSTSIMLGAIFQIAMQMTDGVPAMAAQHQAFADYYAAHASSWLDIAKGWSFSSSCGSGYFANHITFILAHAWAMLETSPAFASTIRDDVLNAKVWAALSGHKNPYFAYLWAATRATPPTTEITDANAQLAQFSAGPRAHVARDTTAAQKYMPHDTTCTAPILCDTATLAVDVGDRVVDDFIWQRQPWQLKDGGDPRQVYPGVDYLAAYWAGRRFGFVDDDRAGTCARMAP
jgi:hypothetical protein